MRNTAAQRKMMRIVKKVTLVLVLIPGIVVMFYPFVWMISSSFKNIREMYLIPPTLIPSAPTLNNYKVVFGQWNVLGGMYLNSIVTSVSATLLQLTFCAMAGYAFAKLRFPGRNLLFVALMAQMMIPQQLTIIPNYYIIKILGLMDSLGALVILKVFSMVTLFLTRQAFMSLPQELEDAARVDGCGFVRSFWSIHLPLARSVLAVGAVLCFNDVWGDFFNPLIFIKSMKHMTLPLGISMVQGMYSQQSPTVMVATLVVALIPVLVLFLFVRNKLVEGIASTGIKM